MKSHAIPSLCFALQEAARIAVVDGRSGHGVEVPLCFGSAPPAAKVQRHAEVGRPFGDASNLPGRASAPITPKQNRETQAPPLPEQEDGGTVLVITVCVAFR